MFKRELIGFDNIAIIDIGSYKIKVAKCNFKKDEINIISYAEKRQERGIIVDGEVNNYKLLSENIKIALKKVDPDNKIKQIVFNSITSDIFITSSKVNFKREKPLEPIKKEEVFHIIKKLESDCVAKSTKSIYKKTSYIKDDLKLLLSTINSIKIDNKNVLDIFMKKGQKIGLSITNIFISNDKYEILESVGKVLGKNIVSIVPEEYSVTKLFSPENDVVIVNIGNLNTFISIKIGDEVYGSTKINIGMNDLFKIIKDKKIIPTEKIIQNLEDNYDKEKKVFLSALKDCLVAGIQEIMGQNVCPHHFFITGGGGKSKFIRKYISKIDFAKEEIKMVKKVEIIEPDFKLDNAEIEKIGTDNVNLLSMIFVVHNFFYDERTVVKDMLIEAVDEIII